MHLPGAKPQPGLYFTPPFSKSNIKACTFTATDFLKASEYWHTPSDTFDKIEKGALENALKVCIGYIINESKAS